MYIPLLSPSASIGANDEGRGLGSLQRSIDPMEGDWVVTIADEDSDTSTGNSWLW